MHYRGRVVFGVLARPGPEPPPGGREIAIFAQHTSASLKFASIPRWDAPPFRFALCDGWDARV